MTDNTLTNTMTTKKLKGRDFITIGIFGLLFAITEIIAAFSSAIIPILWTFCMAIAAIPCGIIFMYIIAKAPKRWAIATAITLCCLIYFLIGTYGIWTPLFGVVGGLLADVIAGTGKYKKFSKNAIAFVVCITLQWLGFMQPILFTTDQYIQSVLESGMSETYIMPLVDFIQGPGFIAGLIATIIMGFVGAYVGKNVLKKHFEKAGVI
ncbi:MAG: MptD family putative ECF transporter S component [Bacteroidales bacterium]|nr:MptD family putative ECF transporter S component [Bacteroidales bacterium]